MQGLELLPRPYLDSRPRVNDRDVMPKSSRSRRGSSIRNPCVSYTILVRARPIIVCFCYAERSDIYQQGCSEVLNASLSLTLTPALRALSHSD